MPLVGVTVSVGFGDSDKVVLNVGTRFCLGYCLLFLLCFENCSVLGQRHVSPVWLYL